MFGEQLMAALLDHDHSSQRNAERQAFRDAVNDTKARIAAAFTKRDPIPARRKP
jgi:hypothetical protein